MKEGQSRKLFEDYKANDAGFQERAVLAYIQALGDFSGMYRGNRLISLPRVSLWINGREKGYVISWKHKKLKRQNNIAFFEHRNYDGICAVEWEQWTEVGETLNINTANFGNIYKDKSDVSKTVPFGRADEMAMWIHYSMENFWRICENKL